jgi:transcriptional regulator with XRE-family HTH domain
MSDTKLTPREKEICRRVRDRRGKATPPLSQEDVAEALGLTKSGYGHYERCKQRFTVEQLFQLSQLFHVPVEELLGLPLPGEMSEDERQLLDDFRRMQSPTLRENALLLVRSQADMDAKLREGT